MYDLRQCKGTGNHRNGKKSISVWIFIGIILISPCLSTRFESHATVSSQDSKKLPENNTGRMCNTANKKGNFRQGTDFTNPFLTAQTPQIINTKLFKINVTNDGYIAQGDRFVVECSTQQKIGVYYAPKLLTPIPDEERFEEECSYHTSVDPYKKLFTWRKIIKSAHKEDGGNYSCIMDDGSAKPPTKTQLIRVFGEREHILDVSAEEKHIIVNSGKTAKWVISINNFPSNFRSILQRTDSQTRVPASLIKIGGGQFKLEIYRVTLKDMGPYQFHVYLDEHPHERKILDLYLTVKSTPIIKFESDDPAEPPMNCMFGFTCTISCKVEAYPPPDSYWTWRQCDSTGSCESKNVSETHKKQIEHGSISSIEFNGTHHGNYTCHAKNSLTPKEYSITKRIRIVDYPGTGAITIIKPEEVVEGDDLKLVCVASKLDNDENITWVQADGTTTMPVDLAKFRTEETQWSKRSTLEIKAIKQSATGTYRCATEGRSPKLEASYHLDVLSIASPQFLDSTNLNNSKITLNLGESKELICNVSGHPRPIITWMWNGHPIHVWENHGELKYSLLEDARILLLKYIPAEAQGQFHCVAQNRNGTVTAFLDVSVEGSRTFSHTAIALIVSLLLTVILCGVILARYKYKQGKMKRFLKEINQKGFYDGDVSKINPEISVSDQAYLLPYDKRFEFPSARLKLGIQLGAGAFGRVIKAEALGILNAGQNTTVAVKMVKPDADETHFKALMSELKIMVHLGEHINVVNLLGACTKSLAKKKEFFIIVEYCKYGSLLSYMHRNKRNFIYQLCSTKGRLGPSIDRRSGRNQIQMQSTLHYAELSYMDSSSSGVHDQNGYRTLKEFSGSNLQGFIKGVAVQETSFHQVYNGLVGSEDDSYSGDADPSSGPVTSDRTTKSRLSYGAPSHDHYRGDYQALEVQPIRTTDLICWAFQISRGMEYLASRKVLHGDLAARNVLLDENRVVKICDFGMAKEMYKDYKYKKNTKGVPLPLKWMAIESIFSGIFSTQSDCWSFGIVLWELFTLGQTPYPGMEADAKFFKLISEGYRMENPKLAPISMYNIMLECWNQEPTERPTFSALVHRIGDMLDERLRKHYVDLNAPYISNNQKHLMAGQTDYLSAMGKTEYNLNNEPASPKGKYENVPTPKELKYSGYIMPASPPVSPFSASFLSQSPNSPQCETSSSGSFIHQPISEAQNPLYGIFNLSAPLKGTGEEMELHENKNEVSLLITHPPVDIKDERSSCRNSYSTKIKSSDEVVLKYSDYSNITADLNGIQGVTNINYLFPNIT